MNAASPTLETRSPAPVALLLVVWLGLAIAAGASGMVSRLVPPAPQLVLVGLTLVTLLAAHRVPTFRIWIDTVDLRLLAGLHVTRFVGLWFLVLYGRGELPWAFAVPGGIGDILVACGALVLVLGPRPATAGRLTAWRAWNLIGLIDILFVVATAARLGMQEPETISALLRLPLSLLPTWLVPLIIASHVILWGRLRQLSTASPPRPM